MIENLVKRIKYRIVWAKALWACGPGWDKIHREQHDESIKRIVESKNTLCLCEVDRIARQFHDAIEQAAQECDASQEDCRSLVPGSKNINELQHLIDNYIRREVMIGALFSSLHHLCDNWKTDSKGSQESIDLYERYYKAYKSSGRKVTSCHK